MASLVLGPSLVSTILILISAIITYYIYVEKGYNELRFITLGLILTSLIPLSFFIFEFIEGEEFNQLRTITGRIAFVATLLGLMIIGIVFLSFSWEKFKFRHYFLIGLILYTCGFVSLTYNVEWINDGWRVTYDPNIGLFLAGFVTFWIGMELIVTAYYNYLYSPKDQKNSYLLVFLSWLFNFLSAFVLIIERQWISETSTIYLIFSSIGFGLLATGIYLNPYSFMRQNINAQYFILSEKDTGIALITYEFETTTIFSQRNILFSSAMQGILSMLSELTGQEDLPPSFGYANFNIMLEYSENFIAYLVSPFDVSPARVTLRKILQLAELKSNDEGKLPLKEVESVKLFMVQELDYVHPEF